MRHHLCGRLCLHGYQICLLQTTQALTCLISSGSKCFSHVNTLPLSIWFWKSLSMTHLRQLIWPLFLPLLVFCILWWVQFKDTNPFSSTACTVTKHRTVVTQALYFQYNKLRKRFQSKELHCEALKTGQFKSNSSNDTILDLCVHGHCHVASNKEDNNRFFEGYCVS